MFSLRISDCSEIPDGLQYPQDAGKSDKGIYLFGSVAGAFFLKYGFRRFEFRVELSKHLEHKTSNPVKYSPLFG